MKAKFCEFNVDNISSFIFSSDDQTGVGFYDNDQFRIIFPSNLRDDGVIRSDLLENHFSSLQGLENKLKELYEGEEVTLIEVFDDYTPLLNLNQFLT